MIWIIGIISAIIFIYLLVRRGMKGPSKTIGTIDRAIVDLLNRGYDGAFLIIDIAHTKYFLQLKKYIKKPGEYGIMLCFPNANWSKFFFQKLKKICIYEKIKYSISKENEALEFLCVDFGKDYDAAHFFIKRILLEIFKVEDAVKLFVRLENATIEDVIIDR